MAEEATAPTETATPAESVEVPAGQVPANDTTAAGKPANDNAGKEAPKPPTEEEFLGWVERFGPEKAMQIVAKKLNYQIDGQVVSVAERAALREEKRKQRAALDQRQREIEEALGSKVKESESEIEFGRALKAANATGDYDGIARALGRKDWNELQDDFIAKLADPNHKRLTELEQKLREKEQAEEQARKEGETRAQHQARMQAIQNYKVGMSREMKASSSRIFRELAENPDVVNMVYAIRDEHYRESGTELPLEAALVRKLPGTNVTLQTLLRGWRDQLFSAFEADEAAPAPKAAAEKPKGKTAPTPPVQPSTARRYADDREQVKSWEDRMRRAFEQDEEAEAAEKRKGNSARPA
jgi:hypothetical protein